MGARGFWRGKKVIVTAGPTREYLDPVRYITNASSGRMGYALAAAARRLGARAVLISGPVTLPAPRGVKLVRVVTAREMEKAAIQALPGSNVFIGAAAVSDWRPQSASARKIKKRGAAALTVKLAANNDILKSVGKKRRGGRPFLAGFALETENLMGNARKKLREKNLDAIVGNPASAIDGKSTTAFYLNKGGRRFSFRGRKSGLAAKIYQWIKMDMA